MSLDPAVQTVVDAINAGDEDAFVAGFATDGLVNDWGTVLTGESGVRQWAQTDAIGANAKLDLLDQSVDGAVTHITFDWRSNKFNGKSEAFVTVADGKVTEFRIPAG